MSKCEASQIKHDIYKVAHNDARIGFSVNKLVNLVFSKENPNLERIVNIISNQYSFVVIAVVFAIVAGFILLTNKPKWNDYLAFGVIIVGLVAAWSILHPRQTPLMEDAKNVQAMVGAGTPVLLEFQSPY